MQLLFGAAANLYLPSEYQTFRRSAAKQASPGSAVENLHVNSSVQLEIKTTVFIAQRELPNAGAFSGFQNELCLCVASL